MEYENIIYEKNGHVATITLNRPEKLNTWPFLGGMAMDFQAGLDEAEEDDDVKVVVIKGAGRAFSAGADLSTVGFVYGMGTGQPGERRPSERIRLKLDTEMLSKHHRRLFLFPKITVAQVHGYCMAGGLIIVENCDLAIAADDAILAHSEQRLGFAGSGNGDIGILIDDVGLKRALYLLLTGAKLTGKQAAEMGLVSKAVPADKLEAEVKTLTDALCKLPRDGIAIGKMHRFATYDSRGLTAGFAHGVLTHTLFTNARWEEDEYNFFKHRRDDGLRNAIHNRDARYGEFDEEGALSKG